MQPFLNHIKKSESSPIGPLAEFPLPQNKKWYVIYTKPRFEKKILEQLLKEGIEAYLPMQITIRQWSDRKKKVSEPLFRCYLFVKISLKAYYTVLNTPGVVRYITLEGKAVVIPERQIRLIQNLLANNLEISEISAYVSVGSKITIKTGQFIGISGELVDYAGKKRVIIRIGDIYKSIRVNIPLSFLELTREF